MALRVSKGNTFALTVSADHIIGRYDLTVLELFSLNGCPVLTTVNRLIVLQMTMVSFIG